MAASFIDTIVSGLSHLTRPTSGGSGKKKLPPNRTGSGGSFTASGATTKAPPDNPYSVWARTHSTYRGGGGGLGARGPTKPKVKTSNEDYNKWSAAHHIPQTVKKKSSGKPSASSIGRRITQAAQAAVMGPTPPDPLELLRQEYDKYLMGVYGGLNTSLEGIRDQYKTRSQELATRLGSEYDTAATTAGQTAQRTQSGLDEMAQRLGLQQATQGRDTADWMATNERLKSLNAANRANSMATNDTIRSNYYDFLVDKIASAKGQEAQSRAGLNDIIAQAQLQRQQMMAAQAAAAAAAAARRSSSRSRGGGGFGGSGSSSGSGTITDTGQEKSTISNQAMVDMLNSNNPMSALVLESLIRNDPTARDIYRDAGRPPKKTGSNSTERVAEYHREQNEADALRRAAAAWYIKQGSNKGGGPIISSTATLTDAQKRRYT